MIGGRQPPHRMPCSGVAGSPRRFLGQEMNQGKVSTVDRYVNSTTVRNPADTDDVPPYENFLPTLDGADGSCEDQGDPLGGSLPPEAQTFSLSGTTDFFACYHRGWKSVQAYRSWHGRFGYLSVDGGYAFDGSDPLDGAYGCGGSTNVSYMTRQLAPDRIKWLKSVATVEWVFTDFVTPANSNTQSCGITREVRPLSGVIDVGGGTATPNDNRNRTLALLFISDWTTGEAIAHFTNMGAASDRDGTSWKNYEVDSIEYPTGSGTFYTATSLVGKLDFDVAAGTYSRSFWHTTFDTGTLSWTRHLDETETLALTDTTLSYEHFINNYETTSGGFNVFSTDEITVEATISVELDDEDVRADVQDNLLVTWPLDDGELFPWRTDPFMSIAPKVTRKEKDGGVGPTGHTAFVRDFGNPIPDAVGGNTMPDPSWSGSCEIFAQLDPETGSFYNAFEFDVTDGDGFIAGLGGPVLSYTGTLPPGLTLDMATGGISGTVDLTGTPQAGGEAKYGITAIISHTVQYDGSIIGAPKPAGYEGYFDSSFTDWKACLNDPETTEHPVDWYPYGKGGTAAMFNSDNGTGLPNNATQWTNRKEAINKPPGAFILYADRTVPNQPSAIANLYDGLALNSDKLWVCKYAEIVDGWPAMDFGRPAGFDKFLLDELAVYKVGDDFDGTNFTPYAWGGDSLNAATISDASGVWGGAAVDGFYAITFSGGQVHLGTKLFDLPSDWHSKSGDDDVAFGRLRWSTKPSLLGAAEGSMSTTTFTFAAAQTSFGMATGTNQEQVDVYSGKMTSDGLVPDAVLASNVTATRTADSTCTLPANYAGAAFLVIHGNPATWYEADDEPKGDFLTFEWLWDMRTYSEYARLTGVLDCASAQVARPTENQGTGPVDCTFQSFSKTQRCLSFIPCGPKVICHSPNGEVFANGITVPFPEDLPLDERYGTKWQAIPMAAMIDGFWQQPHKPYSYDGDLGTFDPANDVIRWSSDDASCIEDGVEAFGLSGFKYVLHYPHAPMVEARYAIPSNYGAAQNESPPALPAGVVISVVDPVFTNPGFQPIKFMGFLDEGKPASLDTIWQLHARLCAAATNVTCAGRDYSADAIQCPPT